MYDYLAKIILLGPSGTGKYGQLPLPLQQQINSPFPAQILFTASIREE